ncbi:MAG: GAF domain-containing protein [Anaerolineae bacterium]
MLRIDSGLQALVALRRQLQAASSFTARCEVIAAFLQAYLSASAVHVARLDGADSSSNALKFSIGETGYSLFLQRTDPLSEEEIAFADMAAALLAAFSRSELSQELEAVYRVAESVQPSLSVEEILGEVCSKLCSVFGAPTCFIALYDREEQVLRFPAGIESHEPVSREPVSVHNDASLAGWTVGNNMPIISNDVHADELSDLGIVESALPRSVICVPMRVGGEVLGAISIQSNEANAFAPDAAQSLMAVAAHVAVLAENAHLSEKARDLVDEGARDYQVAVALRQAIALIGVSLDQDVVFNNLLEAFAGVATYDVALAFAYANDSFRLVASRDFHERPLRFLPDEIEEVWRAHPLLQALVETGAPIMLDDVTQDSRWGAAVGYEQVRSWMGVPLIAGEELVGVMMAYSYQTATFGEREQWLAATLTSHAAVAVKNARLYHSTQRQLAELSTLYRASAAMTANLDKDFVLQTVVTEMVRALKVDSCTIFVWDESKRILETAAHKDLISSFLGRGKEESESTVGLSAIENLEQYPTLRHLFQTRKSLSLVQGETRDPDQAELLQAARLQSALLVPLVRRDQVLGVLALGQQSQPRHFSESEQRLAQNLASQATVAIEHAQLFAQAQRRVKELSALHEIILKLNTPLNLSVVLDTITESALNLVDATDLHIYLYDAESDTFSFGSALWQDGRREAAVESLRPDGITATVVKQARPIVISDASSHPLYQSEEAQSWGICAIAGFPLKHGNQVIGAFTITYLHPHTFTDDELLLLDLLAEQAAVAVRNARLFAESRRRLRDMSALVDMAKQVTGKLNLKSVLQTTVQILRGLFNARASTITMLSEDKTELIVVAAAGTHPDYVGTARMKLGEGVSGEAVRRRKVMYIRDAQKEPGFLFFSEDLRSLLVVPLIVRDEAIGTLTVDSEKPNAFSRSDVQLMTIAGAQVSVAIANARLYEEAEQRAAELAIAYEELKESDRLKDELVQNVSHELRTPLTFVKGYVDLLMEGEMGLVTPSQQEALQIVSDKTDDITRLIDDIITLQRIDASNLQIEDVSMAELIKKAVLSHRMVASRHGLEVKHILRPNEKGMVRVDRGRMNQVLDNIIGNAMKFSPDGGEITVEMHEYEDEVRVVVTDQGIGVPPEKRERIFERFYQVDGSSRRRFGGTGVGLAIVKRIIDAHKGKIWVESELNKGSSFCFTLHRVKGEAVEPEAVSA